MEKVTADFLHQADLKSLNSDKSLTNLIPVINKFKSGCREDCCILIGGYSYDNHLC